MSDKITVEFTRVELASLLHAAEVTITDTFGETSEKVIRVVGETRRLLDDAYDHTSDGFRDGSLALLEKLADVLVEGAA